MAITESTSVNRSFDPDVSTAVFGAALILAFAPIDLLTQPTELVLGLVASRVLAAATLIATFFFFATPYGRRYASPLALLLAFTPAAMVLFMMHRTTWHDSPYFVALTMLVLAIALMINWAPLWSAAYGISTIFTYIGLTVLLEHPMSIPFLENSFSLLGATTLAVLASTLRTRLRRSEFENQWAALEANRHKGEFFANVSHELRTPIHVIIGYTDMLLDGDQTWDGEKGRELLESIRSQGLSLHTLVSDLLDSAKLDSGRMEAQWKPFSLTELVEQTAADYHRLMEEKGLQLVIDPQPSEHNVISDKKMVHQILTNLLSNSFKFTHSGRITIGIAEVDNLSGTDLSGLIALSGIHSKPVLRRDVPSGGLALVVSDTGIGMEPSALEYLAKDYSQPKGPDSAVYGGTGLGLSISRKLARLLGGSIAVRTKRGIGSTFVLFLPRSRDVEQTSEALDGNTSSDDMIGGTHAAPAHEVA